MNRDLISIVVPIYNVENYLSTCIESLLNQIYNNIEVILVNDGSTDNSGKICDYYSNKDYRIRVYHKNNGGLSDARNYGISKANGEYIYLIDSDDFLIRDDTIEILYKNIIEHKAQISIANYIEYFSNNEIKSIIKKENYNVIKLTTEQSIDKLYDYKDYQSSFVVAWNKLYKKSLFYKINYPIGKLHEDEFTTYKLYLEAEKIVFVDLKTYAYRQREGSIMSSNYSLKRLDAIEAFEERINILNYKNIDVLETQYNYLNLLSFNIYMLKKNNYINIHNATLKKFNDLYPLVKDKYNLKRKVKLFILRYFNDFYYKYKVKI